MKKKKKAAGDVATTMKAADDTAAVKKATDDADAMEKLHAEVSALKEQLTKQSLAITRAEEERAETFQRLAADQIRMQKEISAANDKILTVNSQLRDASGRADCLENELKAANTKLSTARQEIARMSQAEHRPKAAAGRPAPVRGATGHLPTTPESNVRERGGLGLPSARRSAEGSAGVARPYPDRAAHAAPPHVLANILSCAESGRAADKQGQVYEDEEDDPPLLPLSLTAAEVGRCMSDHQADSYLLGEGSRSVTSLASTDQDLPPGWGLDLRGPDPAILGIGRALPTGPALSPGVDAFPQFAAQMGGLGHEAERPAWLDAAFLDEDDDDEAERPAWLDAAWLEEEDVGEVAVEGGERPAWMDVLDEGEKWAWPDEDVQEQRAEDGDRYVHGEAGGRRMEGVCEGMPEPAMGSLANGQRACGDGDDKVKFDEEFPMTAVYRDEQLQSLLKIFEGGVKGPRPAPKQPPC